MATSYTYELTNDQQELLLGIMVNGNYRKREVPYSLWSIEGDHFNATLYAKEKHGKRKLCVQGSKAEDFVLFVLEPNVLGVIASLGGQTAINLADKLQARGVKIIGTDVDAIERAENRDSFEKIMNELKIPQPNGQAVTSVEAGVKAAAEIGYPVLVRPSYVLGGRAMQIARVRAAGVDREVFTLCKNEKYGQLIENLENVEDSASQMADFALSDERVAQQISMLAGLTAEDADAALQHILRTDRMATMYILPDGTAQAAEEDEEEEE